MFGHVHPEDIRLEGQISGLGRDVKINAFSSRIHVNLRVFNAKDLDVVNVLGLDRNMGSYMDKNFVLAVGR
jgi:hypothetical protein